MFATTSRFSHSARSWNTVAMPRSSAAAGLDSVTSLPPKVIVPVLGWWTPARTFTSVDFPAPLSPTRATTSPACTSSSMSVRAETAPKCFETARRLSTSSPGLDDVVEFSVMGQIPHYEQRTRHEPDLVLRRAGSVGDSQPLAPFGIAAGGKILGALEPLVDDLRLEILRRDHRRLEERGRRIEERRFGLRGLA